MFDSEDGSGFHQPTERHYTGFPGPVTSRFALQSSPLCACQLLRISEACRMSLRGWKPRNYPRRPRKRAATASPGKSRTSPAAKWTHSRRITAGWTRRRSRSVTFITASKHIRSSVSTPGSARQSRPHPAELSATCRRGSWSAAPPTPAALRWKRLGLMLRRHHPLP